MLEFIQKYLWPRLSKLETEKISIPASDGGPCLSYPLNLVTTTPHPVQLITFPTLLPSSFLAHFLHFPTYMESIALDNVYVRLYVDQGCFYFQKLLLETGALGVKCNTQMVIPHLTENYGTSRNPPKKQAPCARHHHARPSARLIIFILQAIFFSALISQLVGICYGVESVCLHGRTSKGPQISSLKSSVDIVIETPGRLKDLIEMGMCWLTEVSFVVLDEVDRMLDMRFEPEVLLYIKPDMSYSPNGKGNTTNPKGTMIVFVWYKKEAGHVENVLQRKGFSLKILKLLSMERGFAEKHHEDLSSKPFFNVLVENIIYGPIVAMIWECKNVVTTGSKIIGATNPSNSALASSVVTLLLTLAGM
ncbi:Nucleoside diphosphate kinase A [Vitis vinifera]|uniref:nucleoside-diphosphate kinase n=3 Tax=Vitis vinifera TaxID=29760 RepID=A0A438HZ09_VITVI|nr:Nucleoside diphosphate kinase A [Vitis vinifera]